ncbi:bifunctional tRNA (5-methylaminomethyl-2-thiouridine)(34)-methyltransferase MnmD/FAD-dependent 5-carboxymethylaminomethyl-2-thiouridine(34) oxidoreductase MnmC [Pseudoalteromonas luteoviolacea]|uniref:bifunctional tRNA (5-methylaminomethyl-2-thiouridine)(34)-methyltransferase MnmD/FAD-dependent 5-carboxymethylaminomethyl-2-thiouridine(34) oxidoreductase MnmC n=1 Tax=Pseudoalteromonas luteoviolacea TaxID=43657 RepID=UPI001B39417B|nr:bifunctional tRNA (5-methylaminomethyl-2-thiouridine)(34)-methyltransferase MnmD/FAD-dependent 5-carboxymethylaminomethyl-2-thiouridine(34) oxidoreductase MnmC [Pseudoalteromonas luteoviolacea]MBQ4810003.1 bifunctional tRNA (5-methylaminomethyl-2-thiouridine)(34)-methyltransferase MnmD/FAD-dependent 5-carboxymethylaminomethyl-2-thiouridine(34) oxidoreductase MnmC [Pseudoalteromonas luteoviolacea]
MISNAQIHFNELGTPVADNFDDVYFSNDDGLAESNYVFFEQNNLPERFDNHPRPHFVIAETGFGTGLNFLNSWQRFNSKSNESSIERLYFISFEKYPIKLEDLKQALQAWPTLKPLSDQLCDKYPMALQGCHRLEFEQGRVVLDLWFGDVQSSLPQIAYKDKGIVDAWFLDGFAPSKNPDMWQQSLFDAMANLSQADATFATFTAAGFVRRGLQQAGFDCKKVKGYGRKREMVVGQLENPTPHQTTPIYFQQNKASLDNVAIIGGGIATSCLMYNLAKRGIKTTLFCEDDTLAQGASHNRQGAVYPNLQSEFGIPSEFYAHSFLYALRFYQSLAKQNYHFAHQWCGVLLQSVTEAKKLQHHKIATSSLYPEQLIKSVTAAQAQEIANIDTPYGGLFIEQGGWVSPPELTQAVFDAANDLVPNKTYFNTCIDKLERKQDGWYLISKGAELGPFSEVFVCAGEHSDRFEQTKDIGIHGVRGQVSHIEAGVSSEQLSTVICHKGYFTPSQNGQHCMGATFEKHSKSREVTAQDNITNRKQLAGFYQGTKFDNSLGEVKSAKAAVRCCFNDHTPMIGQVQQKEDVIQAYRNISKGKFYDYSPQALPHQGLHIVTGFGARGLCSAPMVTEHLVASLLDEPLPFSERVHESLHPSRLYIRDLIRNKV